MYYDEAPIKNAISYYRIHVPPSTFSDIQSIIYHESPETGYILYSNPVDIIFKIKINSSFAVAEVYNTSSRKLLEFKANAEGIINENIETLPNGIYYFLIKTTDNFIIRGKFVKAH